MAIHPGSGLTVGLHDMIYPENNAVPVKVLEDVASILPMLDCFIQKSSNPRYPMSPDELLYNPTSFRSRDIISVFALSVMLLSSRFSIFG